MHKINKISFFFLLFNLVISQCISQVNENDDKYTPTFKSQEEKQNYKSNSIFLIEVDPTYLDINFSNAQLGFNIGAQLNILKGKIAVSSFYRIAYFDRVNASPGGQSPNIFPAKTYPVKSIGGSLIYRFKKDQNSDNVLGIKTGFETYKSTFTFGETGSGNLYVKGVQTAHADSVHTLKFSNENTFMQYRCGIISAGISFDSEIDKNHFYVQGLFSPKITVDDVYANRSYDGNNQAFNHVLYSINKTVVKSRLGFRVGEEYINSYSNVAFKFGWELGSRPGIQGPRITSNSYMLLKFGMSLGKK